MSTAAPRTAGRHHGRRTIPDRDAPSSAALDDPRARADARRNDRAAQAAWRQGFEAGGRSKIHQRSPDPADAAFHGQHETHYRDAYHQARSDRGRQSAANLFGGGGHQVGGFFLGLVAYALFINYARDGTAGVHAWLKAKFFNDVGASAPSSSASSPQFGPAQTPGGKTIPNSEAAPPGSQRNVPVGPPIGKI